MRKHVILTRLFEFGGSNAHLQSMIKYFGAGNIILVLEDKEQINYLANVTEDPEIEVKILNGVKPYAHLTYPSPLSNLKELINLFRSITRVYFFCKTNAVSDVTVCAVEPEKHLYLLWMPFIPVFYILHTTPIKRFTNFTAFTCNKTLGKKSRIITVSDFNKQEICSTWGINKLKSGFVEVIHNCLVKDGPIRSADALKRAPHVIVTLGHVIAYKNPDKWLQVAKQVTGSRNDVNFKWIGDGPLFEDFRLAVATSEKISFVGYKKETNEYLENAVIYYQPSLFETHGIAVLEAMSYALPCVVANKGGLLESIEDQYNGIVVDPLNIEEQSAALITLLDDDQLRNVYGLNAYKKYQEQFTYSIFAGKMDKIYKVKGSDDN